MLKEFKEFAFKGNVLDLAIGIIVGAAFGKVVSSFVGDVLMPPIGLLLGRMDFSSLFVALDGRDYASLAAAKAAGAPTLNYGLFVSSLIDFIIVAFAIFVVVKQVNRFRAAAPEKVPAPAPEPSAEAKLLVDIRDLLRSRTV